jgi:hypothetical protein
MVAILAIGGIVASVWSVLAYRHGGMLMGCLAVIFVGSCFGHAFFHIAVGPVPITIDRLILAGLFVVFAVSYHTSLVDAKPLAPADWALGILLLVLTISTLTHDWQIDASQPVATLLFFYGLPIAIYWLARQAQLERSHLHLLLASSPFSGCTLPARRSLKNNRSGIWSSRVTSPRPIMKSSSVELEVPF